MPPFCNWKSENSISGESGQSYESKTWTIIICKDSWNQSNFKNGGENVKQHRVHNKVDSSWSSFQWSWKCYYFIYFVYLIFFLIFYFYFILFILFFIIFIFIFIFYFYFLFLFLFLFFKKFLLPVSLFFFSEIFFFKKFYL